jgi:hypothetical protein
MPIHESDGSDVMDLARQGSIDARNRVLRAAGMVDGHDYLSGTCEACAQEEA